MRFLSFDNCETWLSCLRLSAAIKTKCCHIKHLLKVDFWTTSTLADTFKQIYLNKFGNYEKSRIKQRLEVKFNLQIRQSFNYSESERERQRESQWSTRDATRHDTQMRLINNNCSAKSCANSRSTLEKATQANARWNEEALPWRSLLSRSLCPRSSYWPSAPAVGSPSYDYDKWPAAGWAYFTMCWKIEWSDNEVLLISTGDLFSDKQWTKLQQNYANFVPDIDDESLTLFL